MRRLNVKLVIWLSTTSLLLIVLVGVVHAWQMKRTANVLLVQAKAAEEEEELNKAASFYRQYVEYVPDNAEEGAHMALLMADIAEQPGASNNEKRAAYDALEAQLRRHLERDDVRRRLVDYTIMNGRFGDAIEHIQALLKTDPEDVDLLTKYATCEFCLEHNRESATRFEQVIEKDPSKIIAYGTLARILRERLSDPDRADQIINTMVEVNPENARARLARAEYLREFFPPQPGQVSEQVELRKADLKKALELAPDDADVLLLSALAALQERNVEEARRHLEHGSKLYPDDERIIRQLIGLDALDQKFDSIADRLKSGPKSVGLQQIDFEVRLAKEDLDGARQVLAAVEKDKDAAPPVVDYMRALLDFKERKWLQASKKLEALRPMFPERANQIDMMLGHCYELLGEYDRELEAYQRAAAENSTVAAHVGLARALMIVGQPDRALSELQRVKRAQGIDEFVKSGPARNALLTLLLQKNSRLPQEEQDWKEVDELADATKEAFKEGSKEWLLVDSTIREQKGDRGAAREMLQAATEKDPKDFTAWLSLARLSFLEQGAEAALELLDGAKQKAGDSFSLRSAQIAYATQLSKEKSKESLKTLSDGLGSFTEDERDQLIRTLGIAYFRLDDWAQARAMWTKAAEKKANDPQVQFILLDIATREGDDAKIAQSVESIKRLFGISSAEAKYAEARQKIVPVREKRSNDSKAAIAEARQLLHRAAEQRPRWSVLARFEAEIDVLDGRLDDAIEHLRHAFDLGDTDISTAREIARLMVIRGRGEEAKQYIQIANNTKAPGTDTGISDMLEVGVALTENDIPKAVKLLEQARERTPDDPQKILTLAHLLPQLGREEDAEKLLRELLEKDPEQPIGWLELVKLLAEQKRADDAKQVIAEAEKSLSKEKGDLVIGQFFEVLGDLPTAEKRFIQARDAKPDDIGRTRALATFYLRTKNPVKAKEQLERLSQAKPSNEGEREHLAWGNRELAKIIASAGTYRDVQEALNRLRPAQGKTASLADKLTMAELLYRRPEADSRQEAASLLEEIRTETALQPDGQVILAQLYEATGNWPKSRDEMLSVLGKVKDNPNYIASFVDMLLRNKDLDAALFWLDKLEQLSPESSATAALKAKVLVKQGKPDEAVAVLRNLLPRPMPREKLGQLVSVALLLEQIEQNDAAEAMYREYAALEPKAILLLAGFAGRHGNLKDSLDLCQSALEMPDMTVDSVVREALTSLRLHQDDAAKEDYARVEGWLTKAIARKPKEMMLRLDYAELLDLQGRYAELEEIYQGLLKNAEVTGYQRAFVLNNMAYLLAAQGKTGDSRKLIEEAVQIMGPTSDLRDTRALVYLTHGEAKKAIDDLTLSVIDQPSGIKYFHMARAYQLAKDSQGAQDAMRKAVDGYGLKLTDLPRLEQNAFKQLSQTLGIQANPEARASSAVPR